MNVSIATYCGCVLYTVPSKPTVIFSVLKLRFCIIRVKMAARPAATRFEDLKDTIVLTCWTAMQSSDDGVKSSSRRIFLVFSRPFLYLKPAWLVSEDVWYKGNVRRTHRQITYSSMAATCAVVIFPLVFRALDTFPSNSSPSLAIFNTTSLTNSPRYSPLIIFSKLQVGNKGGNTDRGGIQVIVVVHTAT